MRKKTVSRLLTLTTTKEKDLKIAVYEGPEKYIIILLTLLKLSIK
jgi:hypothetical protein